jgi:hypothetical protein
MASGVRPDSTEEPDLHGADEKPLELEELELGEGLLLDRYSLRTQRRCESYKIADQPDTLPVVKETLLPAARTVTDSAVWLGAFRTWRPVVV